MISTKVDTGEDRKRALNVAIGSIEKAYGKGSIMRMGVNGPMQKLGCIPTGAICWFQSSSSTDGSCDARASAASRWGRGRS